MSLQWLEWAQQLQAIAQNGLTYSEGPYDIERYRQLRSIAAAIMATHSQTDLSYVLDLFNAEEGYATPKVDVRGAIFQDEKILLVKERSDGRWTLPGGWADIGDSPSSAIEREILEESGYQAQVVKLLAVYDRSHPRHGHPPLAHYVYKLFFQCQIVGGAAKASLETEAVQFFSAEDIPELSSTRVMPGQISRLFEHYRNPNLPTDFD
ncbi:MAG: NUDIX hydrolase [Cyanobacteria bacterium J06626_18]